MKNATLLPIFLGALGMAPSALHASRGMLNADGILVVKGADISTARITIVPENAAAYGLEVGTKRFTLRLPVNDTYLVSFVREGCPTKEVYFDTRVPVEFTARDFDFPFQVTLEHLSPERMFTYEGPVGFVRYQHPITDFGYDTQYIVKVDDELRERMKEMEATGTDPKVMSAMSAMVVDVSRDGSERVEYAATPTVEEGDTAPMVSEVPKMVHVVSAPGVSEPAMVYATEEEPMVSQPEPLVEEAPVVVEAVVSAPALAAPVASAPPAPKAAPSIPRTRAVPVATAKPMVQPAPTIEVRTEVSASMQAARMIKHREEEVLVDQRMVTRVVRFVRADGVVTDELRKVTHAYGAVFYFHNAQSITERAFRELTAVEEVAASLSGLEHQ